MRYGVLFAMAATCLSLVAATEQAWAWLLLWPAASMLLLGLAYLGNWPHVFAKTRSGRLGSLSRLLLWPYWCVQIAGWYALRLLRPEPAFHRLTECIWIGRRLLAHERPAGIAHVVDLTAEFDEPASMCVGSYFCIPILDGMAPPAAALQRWVAEIQARPGVVYVHCAEGHGRTGLFAAALLLESGLAADAEQAVAAVTACRPKVRLSSAQWRVLRQLQRMCDRQHAR